MYQCVENGTINIHLCNLGGGGLNCISANEDHGLNNENINVQRKATKGEKKKLKKLQAYGDQKICYKMKPISKGKMFGVETKAIDAHKEKKIIQWKELLEAGKFGTINEFPPEKVKKNIKQAIPEKKILNTLLSGS